MFLVGKYEHMLQIKKKLFSVMYYKNAVFNILSLIVHAQFYEGIQSIV